MFPKTLDSFSLTTRITLLAFTTILFALLASGAILLAYFQKSQQASIQAHFSAYFDILIAATKWNSKGQIYIDKRIALLQPMPFIWQIDIEGKYIQLSEPFSLPVNSSTLMPQIISIPEKGEVVVMQKSIEFPGKQQVHYTIAIAQEIWNAMQFEQTKAFTIVMVVVFLGLICFLLIALVFIQIKIITRPLKHIQSQLQAVQEGKENTISQPFPKEIQLLVDEINMLITYNARLIERYHHFSSNVAHALKTPLTVMLNEAQLTSPKLAEIVKEKSHEMLALIDRNLARVKTKEGMTYQVAIPLKKILYSTANSFAKLYQKTYEIKGEVETIEMRGHEADIYEMLGNVIENACKYAHSHIRIHVVQNKQLVITIEDDGPGIDDIQKKEVFTRGMRLDETKPGSGIGLTVAYDIALLYDGTITLSDSKLGGLKVVFTFKT